MQTTFLFLGWVSDVNNRRLRVTVDKLGAYGVLKIFLVILAELPF
jgi:hypothetical protein